jgi:putative membrane protein
MKTFITVALSTLTILSATSVRAQEKGKPNTDEAFLTKVIPGIGASVKVIEHAAKYASDEKVRDFAERVAKQHKGSLETASTHARRLKIAIISDPDQDSREMIDKLSKVKGVDVDIAFLTWLSHIHKDSTMFDNEVKNGADADLKTYARNSIIAGNEHLKEASELLAKVKK